jgi:prefoldin subunit 5
VLLFSLISLGLQSLLISLVKAKIFNILLSGVVIGVIVSFYKKFEYSDILYKFMLVLLFIRFALPVIDVANGYIYNEMMRNQILTIQKNNQKFNDEIQKFMPNNVEIQKLQQNLKTLKAQKQQILDKSTQNMSYFDRLKAKFNYDNLSFNEKSKLQNIDKQIENINKKLDKLDINPYDKIKLFIKKVEHNMDNFFTQSYTAIILFLARGIVFPILFLWGLIRLFRMEGLIQRFNR